MLIGFQSSTYDNLSLFEELNFAKENKVDFFDIFFDGFLPDSISKQEWNLFEKMKKNNFEFTVHLPIKINELSENELLSLSDFVKKIKAKTVTVHFDKLSFEFLEKLYLLFGKNSKLCIENTIPDFNPFTRQNYFDFIRESCQKFDVYSTFDTGHCNVNLFSENKLNLGKISLFAEKLLRAGVQIATVHAHDNDGTKDSHSFVSSGVINFSDFFYTLKSYNQTPMIVIEHWKDNLISKKQLEIKAKN